MTAQSRFLDLVEGEQEVYVSDLVVGRDAKSGRRVFKITMKSAPGFEAPFHQYFVRMPLADDGDFAKRKMDDQFKAVVYPLAGLKPEEKTTVKTLKLAVLDTLQGDGLQRQPSEIKCKIVVEQREGNQLNKNGDLSKFSTIVSLEALALVEKTPYVSDIDYTDLDETVPF